VKKKPRRPKAQGGLPAHPYLECWDTTRQAGGTVRLTLVLFDVASNKRVSLLREGLRGSARALESVRTAMLAELLRQMKA
jgi:hypothetical protein